MASSVGEGSGRLRLVMTENCTDERHVSLRGARTGRNVLLPSPLHGTRRSPGDMSLSGPTIHRRYAAVAKSAGSRRAYPGRPAFAGRLPGNRYGPLHYRTHPVGGELQLVPSCWK